MKKMLLAAFSAFLVALNLLSAQITITNAVFPALGDTLKYATDNNPSTGINPATPPGGSQVWDFSALDAEDYNQVVFQSPNSGQNAGNFPAADIAVIGTTGETYYNITNTQFQLLGYAGADPANFGLNVVATFIPVLIERSAPVNFFDINSWQSDLRLTFPTDQPPLDTLFDNLPVNIDSLRVNVTTNRLEVVDGWGNCVIPGGNYPVLRQKRTEYQTTGMEVYVVLFPGFGNWVDLSTLVGGGGLGNFIGTDTTVSYRFLNNIEKEEIAVAVMSNDLSEVRSVQFKNANIVSDFEPVFGEAPGNASIQAFPNPAVEWVRFDCANLPKDTYTLKLFNSIGRIVWKEDFQISGNRSIRIELESFKKGTYLYSLVDSKGKAVSTKRLVVLKP